MAGLRQPGGNSPAGVSGRQMESGRPAARSSRAGTHRANTIVRPWRLDPFSLPERFTTADAAADEGLRVLDLNRERVILRRALSAMRMAVNLPVAAYRGVALSVEPEPASGAAAYRLRLSHADPDLEVLLSETKDSSAAAADWKYWSFFLDLPRLASENGEVAPLSAARGKRCLLRRRNNASVAKRRPRFLARRKRGEPARAADVFRAEREIICYE